MLRSLASYGENYDCSCVGNPARVMLGLVQFIAAFPKRIADKFVVFSLMDSASGYEFREEIKNLQRAFSGSAH